MSYTGGEVICSRGCVDVERARLLHQYALHRAGADAQRLADFQYARAALVEAQDALFQLGLPWKPRCCLAPTRIDKFKFGRLLDRRSAVVKGPCHPFSFNLPMKSRFPSGAPLWRRMS